MIRFLYCVWNVPDECKVCIGAVVQNKWIRKLSFWYKSSSLCVPVAFSALYHSVLIYISYNLLSLKIDGEKSVFYRPYSLLTFQSLLVKWRISSLTFNNFIFCSHCIYLKQTATSAPVQHKLIANFDVLLTVHLSIILIINQLNAQILVL